MQNLYVATNSGVMTFFKKVDAKRWQLISHALQDIDVTCLYVDPTNNSKVYAGSENGRVYEKMGKEWHEVSKLDGKVYCLGMIYIDENLHVYAGIEPAKLFLSLDQCKSWHELKSLQNIDSVKEWHSPWGPPDLNSVVFHPRDHRQIYVGIEVGGVMRSTDEGANWTEVSNGLNKDIHCLAINYFNPKIIFAATGGGIYRTVSAGELWTEIGHEIDLKYAVSVAIHPRKPHITYLAVAMGPPGNQVLLYKSDDYGETWGLMHNGLPYPMLKGVRRRALIVNHKAPAEVYVGTSDGIVFYSSNEGMKWEYVANATGTINALALGD
ncbi:MAG: WD40/YVTN/BNR-like repeat-containing protein [Nitrososphaerales archaeon]